MASRKLLDIMRLCAIVAITAFALAPAAVAQSVEDEGDDDGPRALVINLELKLDGMATVSAYGPPDSSEPADIKTALQSALGCQLQDTYTKSLQAYFGKCKLPLRPAAGLLHEYRLATVPLFDYLKQQKIELLTVQLTLPDIEAREVLPPGNPLQLPAAHTPKRLPKYFDRLRFFSWRADSPAPPDIEMRFGYGLATVRRAAALLFTALLAPILLAFWLRRRALSANATDRASVWFSYIRCQQWVLTGSLLLWWAVEQSVELRSLVTFVLQTRSFTAGWLPSLLSTLISWLLPSLVWIACVVISHPVQEQLRGLRWTKKELTLQAVYSLGSALFPLLFGLQGIGAIARANFRAGVLWILAALVLKLVAATRLLKLLGMQPQALTTGELRDAAFGMAQRLGVRLQQIFIIPAGKGQMANAFARKGNTIAFTDYLLHRMSRREVNFVLAHELSHLRLKHPQKLSYALAGSLTAAIFLGTSFRAALPDSYFFRYGLFFAIITLVTYFWSRRFEYSADRGAVESTGDPQGAISALYKLAALNMHPMHWGKWSEKWLTHPSTLRRAEAIAKRAAIPVEGLPQIAQTAIEHDSHYEIPVTALAGTKVLSTTRKAHGTLSLALAMLGGIILTPTAFALLVKFANFSEPLRLVLYVAGALTTVLAYLMIVNLAPAWKLRPLIPQLKAKTQSDGVQPDEWNGIPVGLSPGPFPRTYEGYPHWDLGFLFLRSDRICYWGEETHFALRRDQVMAIRLGPGTPNILPTARVYISWRDLERSTCGVFSLAAAQPVALSQLRRQTNNLAGHLLQWHSSNPSSKPVPAPLDSLSSPQLGTVTGVSPLTTRKRSKITKELYLCGLLAAGVAVIAGLPFHLSQALTALLEPRRQHAVSIGSGWYVVGVTLGVLLLQYLPYFRYKEVPVLQANLGTATKESGQSTSAPKDAEQPTSVNA